VSTSSRALQEQLAKIRIQFLFDHPFLSVLALSLPLVWRDGGNALFVTDGMHIYVDSTYATRYSADESKYLYGHILLHILLKHPARMRGRQANVWNRACDIAINLLMGEFARVGVRPSDEVYEPKFLHQSVEEIYNALYVENPEGEGTPDEDNPQEQKRDIEEGQGDAQEAIEALDALIIQALGAAQKAGAIPSSFLELITEVTRPKIDLETLLESYMMESFFDKQSDFSRPNRRYIHQNLYLPGYSHARNRLEIIIALDRSMSISTAVFGTFLGIIDRVVRMSGDFEVTVVPFDERVDSSMIVRYGANASKPTIAMHKGNGGTQIEPLFAYVEQHASADALLLVLSDGLFAIHKACTLPTLFLINQKRNLKRLERFGELFYFDL